MQQAFSQGDPFITTWGIETPGDSITISTPEFTFDFEYHWISAGDTLESGSHTDADGELKLILASADTLELHITGQFPHFIDYSTDKLLDVNQWGDIAWESMESSFKEWPGTAFSATDAPDLKLVTSMNAMFKQAGAFNGDLSTWAVDSVTDMTEVFFEASDFNGDITDWNVSSVKQMDRMFTRASSFNQDISAWDVHVESISAMFKSASAFNQEIGAWDVSLVTSFHELFNGATSFNGDIGAWDMSGAYNCTSMFQNARAFNQDISAWDISSVTVMPSMFNGAVAFNQPLEDWEVTGEINLGLMFEGASSFNQDLTTWDVDSATTMARMFRNATAFNGDISTWSPGRVNSMQDMFSGATSFNSEIGGWDVGNVANMGGMFTNATSFNQDISAWDVSSLVNTRDMFNGASSFNQDLSGWNVSKVTNMQGLFVGASAFNGDVTTWDMDSVSNMSFMFQNASSFNQDISGWDTRSATTMQGLFQGASSFNQDLSTWDIESVENMAAMFDGSALNAQNYDKILIGWATQDVVEDVTLGADGMTYCLGESARATLEGKGWTINDEGLFCSSDTDITSFALSVQKTDAVIDTVNHTVSVEAFFTADLTALVAEIETSDAALISPAQGDTLDFTNPVTYTVTAVDGTTQDWEVTVTKASPSTDAEIAAFVIPEEDGIVEINTVNRQISIAQILTKDILTPTIELSFGASSSPASGESIDFSVSDTVTYIVTAEDQNTQQVWKVYQAPFQPFITTWQMDAAGDLTIPLSDNNSFDDIYDFVYSLYSLDESRNVIDTLFQDETHETTTGEDLVLAVSAAGNYQLAISGTFPHFKSTDQFLDVAQWGDIRWQSMRLSFEQWGGTAFSASDAPDLSQTTDMFGTFYNASSFNQDLDNWDVSSITNMVATFRNCTAFNGDITNWEVSNVTDMNALFANAQSFNQDIGAWDVSQVTNMTIMFQKNFAFNQDLSDWQVGQVQIMSSMFDQASTFNQDLNSWDVSSVTNMSGMFKDASAFNGDISSWQTTAVTNMSSLFKSAPAFNGDISSWVTTAVTNMVDMFNGASSFNGSIGSWDVSQVTNIAGMFTNASAFNQDITAWDVSAVTNMQNTFRNASSFNQALGSWDVGALKNMREMFRGASVFNQDLDNWNVGSVTNMVGVFREASSFNQNLSTWNVDSVENMANLFRGSALSSPNYDKILIGWAAQDVVENVTLGVNDITYCLGESAHTTLEGKGWTITDGGLFCSSENDILRFELAVQKSEAVIDTANHTIDVEVFFTADITALVPETELSIRATISPAKGDTLDFTNPIIYTVTAVDGSTQDWVVTVTRASVSAATDFLSFDLSSTDGKAKIDTVNHRIAVVQAVAKDVITPTFELSFGAVSSPQSGDDIDFSVLDTLTYVVTAEDQTTEQEWKVYQTAFLPFVTAWQMEEAGDLTIPLINNNSFDDQYDFIYSLYSLNESNEVIDTLYLDSAFQTSTGEDLVLSVLDSGKYQLVVSGEFPHFRSTDNLLDVLQWGDVNWKSMKGSFQNWKGSGFSASDVPNLREVKDMENVFRNASNFNEDLSAWDVSQVTIMIDMFNGANSFNQSLNSWDVSKVLDMRGIFVDAKAFNSDISGWDMGGVSNMSYMFQRASSFNQDISGWDTGSATTMKGLFEDATAFNQNLNSWDVSQVTDMVQMFDGATAFNQDLDNWDVSQVTNMQAMLRDAKAFNGNVSSWDVSSATNLQAVFRFANVFNGDISGWDVSKATTMAFMFDGATSFNQDISAWNPEATTTLESMFEDASSFDQDISGWNVRQVSNMNNMFLRGSLSMENYDKLLIGWAALDSLQSGVTLGGLSYCSAEAGIARDSLISKYSWTINDGGKGCSAEVEILNFDLLDQVKLSIDSANRTLLSTVLLSTDISSLAPVIEISEGAQIVPASGDTLDFTNPVAYTVTAEDGKVQDWIITVQNATTENSEKNIVEFKLPVEQGVAKIDTVAHEVTISQFLSVDLLTPTIRVSAGASISPESGTSIDFSVQDTITYVVTAEDQSQQEWKVFKSDFEPFITTWESSAGEQISIGLDDAFEYDFAYAWISADTVVLTGQISEGPFSTTLPAAGSYQLMISGDFPHFEDYPSSKLQDVNQWGEIQWKSMAYSFSYYKGEDFSATDVPDLSQVSSMEGTFSGAYNFNGDISDWNVSNVTDMDYMFYYTPAFQRDLNSWDVSKVTSMEGMFMDSENFNGELSSWDVSSVTNMSYMFGAEEGEMFFNGDISSWDVSSVINMEGMFYYNQGFNEDLSKWDVSKVTNMSYMFGGAPFSGDISGWDVSNVTDMSGMFNYAQAFNGDLRSWDVSSVKDMSYMFSGSVFNGDVSDWDVSKVTDMSGMFEYAQVFNGDLSNWDVSSVKDMSYMFSGAVFNGDINTWEVDSVKQMYGMFSYHTTFNGNISSWNVGQVEYFNDMFYAAASFDGDLSSWDVSAAIDMDDMFNSAGSFNGDLSAWNVAKVKDMSRMFSGAIAFNGDLSTWNVTGLTHSGTLSGAYEMFNNSGLSSKNYDKLLIGWLSLDSLNNNVRLGAVGITFCEGSAARDSLIANYSWVITDGGQACSQATDILNFVLSDQTGEAVIDADAHTVDIEVAFGTDRTVLTPDITVSQGATVSPISGELVDFSTPVSYTVTARDTTITQEWIVTVTEDSEFPDIDTDILRFALEGQIGAPLIDTAAHTVQLTLMDRGDLDVTALIPEIVLSEGASSEPATGAAVDFSNSVSYTVTAEDGTTVQDWVVTVSTFNTFNTTWSVTGNKNINVPINSEFEYDFIYYWENLDDPTLNGHGEHSSGLLTIALPETGNYQLSIAGQFPHFKALGSVTDVVQWGDISWASMNNSFSEWSGTGFSADDVPDLSLVTDMSEAFAYTPFFNADLSKWDMSSVTDMSYIFLESKAFNSDISDWDVSSVMDMSYALAYTAFDGDISSWTVDSVQNMSGLFSGNTSFKGDISAWNVGKVTNMNYMFAYTDYNGDISNWDVSSVISMYSMFYRNTSFDRDLSKWDLGSLEDAGYMFSFASSFNSDLSAWDVGALIYLNNMFYQASSFSGDLSGWNVSSAVDMDEMFRNATSFNSDLSNWEVSNVTDMSFMFDGATAFDQNLGAWNVTGLTNSGTYSGANFMFRNSGLSGQNYDKILIGWSSLDSLKNGVRLGANNISYCQGAAARDSLISKFAWVITDGGQVCSSEADILAFELEEQTGPASIDASAHTIDIEVAFGTSVTSLTPELSISAGAISNPASGTLVDFSDPVIYTVSALDGSSLEWTVTVTVEPNTATELLTFELPEQTGAANIDAEAHTVSIEVAFGTDMTILAPTVTLSEGATSSPASGEIVDFSSAVTYTVTAEDGVTTQEWLVTVTVEEEILTVDPELEWSFYPNPVRDLLQIRSEEEVNVYVVDMNGQIVIPVQRGQQLTLKLEGLESGVYFLIAKSSNWVASEKIIKGK